MLSALHEDFSCAYTTVDVVCKLRYSGRLFTGGIVAYMTNIRDVEVDTLNLLCSKFRLFTCSAMKPMLSGVAVRGRIWHAAHALAREKSVLSSLWRKNQVDYDGEPRRSGYLFVFPLQTPKHAHFLKPGKKKWHTFLCTNGRFRKNNQQEKQKGKNNKNKNIQNKNKNNTKKNE